MHRLIVSLLAAGVVVAATPARAQTAELNLFTDLSTQFPPGCLSIDIPTEPDSPDSLLVSQTVDMPAVGSDQLDEPVAVNIWRVACADEGFSVVLIRLDPQSGSPNVLVPRAYAEAGNVELPLHEAQLLKIPGAGNVSAAGGFIPPDGGTWMLGANPVAQDGSTLFLPEDYNQAFTLELNWGNYSDAQPGGITFLLDQFEPELDPPQFEEPVLNGRFSGQWVLEGAPRQGLVLQIAERVDDNFVFAIFFTYLDGEPVWVVGNSAAGITEPGAVTIENMLTLSGGAFMTDPNQPAREDIPQTPAGSITIEVIDCNRIRVNYDFTPLGQGTGSIELDRLVRIAGYDCNPWATSAAE